MSSAAAGAAGDLDQETQQISSKAGTRFTNEVIWHRILTSFYPLPEAMAGNVQATSVLIWPPPDFRRLLLDGNFHGVYSVLCALGDTRLCSTIYKVSGVPFIAFEGVSFQSVSQSVTVTQSVGDGHSISDSHSVRDSHSVSE